MFRDKRGTGRSCRSAPSREHRLIVGSVTSVIELRLEGTALHVLFVCTGNICRSPTAERLAQAYGDRHGVADLQVSSAGTRAVIGHEIHPDAAAVLESRGVPTSDFAARQITPKIASGADLILTMTKEHRDYVLRLVPRMLRRTFTLSEAAGLAAEFGAHDIADLAALRPRLLSHALEDVADPIGQDRDFFELICSQIAGLLPPILELGRPS